MSQLEVEADIPLAALPLIDAGDSIAVRSDAVSLSEDESVSARIINGQVRQFVPVASDNSRRVKLMVQLPRNSTQQWDWIVGMPVQVAVPLSEVSATMAVPRDALVLRNGETFVYRIDKEDKAERLTVRVGSGDGEWIAVYGDLDSGDRVVVRGAERLQSGQDVKILSEVVRDEDGTNIVSGT